MICSLINILVFYFWLGVVLFSGFVFAHCIAEQVVTLNLDILRDCDDTLLRGLPMLLEPSVGFAYILDVVIIFSYLSLSVVCFLVKRM